MEQSPIIRSKVVTVLVRNSQIPTPMERDMQLERAHIVGVRLITVELQDRTTLPGNPKPLSTAQAQFFLVKWVNRHMENVYDNGSVRAFLNNPISFVPRQPYRPVSWEGLNLRESTVTGMVLGEETLPVPWEIFYVERQDL